MVEQMSIGNIALGYPGTRVGSVGNVAIAGVNDSGSAKQISSLVIDTVTDSTAYTFTFEGASISITSGVDSTAASIRDLLIDAARASDDVNNMATVQPHGDDVYFTARVAGDTFTVADSDSKLTSSNSVQAAGTPQALPFGRMVVKRTGGNSVDASCMLPSAAGQIQLGVAERMVNQVSASSAAAEYAPFHTVSILRQGRILVAVEGAVTVGAAAFFRYTASGSLPVGGFSVTDDGSTDPVTGGTFQSSTTGAGLAVLELK